MSLKKKLGMAVLTTTLGATIVAAGSFALFTSSATNTGNTFTAGTVDISQMPANGALFATNANLANLAPGDSGNGTITVTNNGSLDAWVALDQVTGSGALFTGVNAVALTPDADVELIPAGGSATFEVGYAMPLAAGNEYQGVQGTVDVTIKAVQARNNANTTNDGPAAWN